MTNIIILTEDEIKEGLKELPGWEYAQNKISKEFKFADFMGSLDFINKLAPFCEKIDHHPDAHIFYNKVLFELQRFDVGQDASEAGSAGSPVSGKVTDKDFLVAREIERLFNSSSSSY